MQKVKCVRDTKIFRVDYEAGKVYEVEDDLAARLLKHMTIIGPTGHRCFVQPDGKKKKGKKTAKKKRTKKAAGKNKPAKETESEPAKETENKPSGPAHPMTA